jgi:hypothetical protein
MPILPEQDGCDRCGGPITDGYELRQHGPRGAQTGYQDEEVICVRCAEKEAEGYWPGDDDGRYEAGDVSYDLEVGA